RGDGGRGQRHPRGGQPDDAVRRHGSGPHRPGRLRPHAAAAVRGGPERGRARPARHERHVRRRGSAREARRELHAAGSGQGDRTRQRGQRPMMPELGQVALILVLCLGLIQATLPLAGAARGRADWMALARPTAAGQFVFAALAFGVLAHAFLTNDFSVQYVALNSNSELPGFYKFAAVWGGHEGSLLFWITVLAIWTLAVAWSARKYPPEFTSRVLAVLGIVS